LECSLIFGLTVGSNLALPDNSSYKLMDFYFFSIYLFGDRTRITKLRHQNGITKKAVVPLDSTEVPSMSHTINIVRCATECVIKHPLKGAGFTALCNLETYHNY